MPIHTLVPIHEVLQATESGDSEGGYGKGEITRGPIGTKMCPVTSPPFPNPWLSGLIPAQFGRKKAPKKRPGGAPSDLQTKYAVVQSAPSHLQSKYAVVQSAPSHLQSKYAVVQSAPSHFTSYIIQYWSQRLTITMSGHKMHRVLTTSVGFYKIIMANTSAPVLSIPVRKESFITQARESKGNSNVRIHVAALGIHGSRKISRQRELLRAPRSPSERARAALPPLRAVRSAKGLPRTAESCLQSSSQSPWAQPVAPRVLAAASGVRQSLQRPQRTASLQ
ncbi:hypothetical protein FKP32DRAFT_1600125, partial [Trametes sanguinea]